MQRIPITLGGAEVRPLPSAAEVEPVERDGSSYLRMRNADALEPFFMSIVSGSDLWAFVGSNGSLCAGRRDPEGALFPYQTADKLLADPYASGSMSIFLVQRNEDWMLWEPWQASGRGYRLDRDLYKHIDSTSLVFSETNHDLGMCFEWEVTCSSRFGIVRRCRLTNLDATPVRVRYVDGWHRLIAPGITPDLFSSLSYLAQAYMRSERVPGVQLAAYALQGVITDRAEPGEHLRSTCAWCLGHVHPTILLSSRHLEPFRRGGALPPASDTRGEFGSFLVHDTVDVPAESSHAWTVVTDTGIDYPRLRDLRGRLKNDDMVRLLDASIDENHRDVRRRIAAADGDQATADRIACIHHASNVLFNCMRGGIFDRGYLLPGSDFASMVHQRSPATAAAHRAWLSGLPGEIPLQHLLREAREQGDPHLARLAGEYMPLTFGRRHGDPSRPWNHFSIRVQDEAGEPAFQYEGNWRDIFQNWEALGASFPAFYGSMINVFLNASTADGYNPYRISRNGIDWETFDPADPWSHIGYWGDHQIIYLLRLLERQESHYPGALSARLEQRIHTYAEVPYEIGAFDALCQDPRHSVSYNEALNKALRGRAETEGADAKLLCGDDGRPVLVSLAEKLLVPFLAKLSNLVPGGGIWLNTQRPEWNDANNALAGWGLSVVTVCHMYRYAAFCLDLMQRNPDRAVPVSSPVFDFLQEICRILAAWPAEQDDDRERFAVMERLGKAGETYRKAVYLRRPMDTQDVALEELSRVFSLSIPVLRRTLHGNRREDGLYHSYNILRLNPGEAAVGHLHVMLEGQVAILDSHSLNADEALRVVTALRESELYREDLKTYMLYPDRDVPGFLDRNVLSRESLASAPVLSDLLGAGDRSIVTETPDDGTVHFHGDLHCAQDVESRLEVLMAAHPLADAISRDRQAILDLWERTFRHREFTGRSGSMFAFEGLGSVYWHMVAKLLVAVQENYRLAVRAGEEDHVCHALAEAYDAIRRGLGFCHDPADFGAFPTDPYSHSPRHRGAQQPGMTGQVKEEILTRRGELGIVIEEGRICFRPALLHASEFIRDSHVFRYVDVSGAEVAWELPPDSLGFTVCQTPVCYTIGPKPDVRVSFHEEDALHAADGRIDRGTSQSIFNRTGAVKHVSVTLPKHALRP